MSVSAISLTQARTQAKRGDGLLYLLLLVSAMCLPGSIMAAGWVPEPNRLLYTAFWGAVAGLMFARSPLPYWLSMLAGTILGAEYAAQFAGRLLPRLAVLLDDVGQAFTWVWQLASRGAAPEWAPFSRTISHVATQGQIMIANLATWLQVVQSGGVSEDNTALWLGVSFGVWMLTFHLGHELLRRRRTFVALLPLGVAVVANVAATGIGMAYVHTYLAATMVTLVWANTGHMERVWARLGLDFSPELRRDAFIAGSFVTGLVLAAAVVLPYVTYNRAVFYLWDRIGPALEAFYEDLDRAFAGRNPVPEPTPSGREADLPGHTISSGALPGAETVFTVRISDPPPPLPEELEEMGHFLFPEQFVPKHYWRQRTYDIYTGHGWDSSEPIRSDLGANEPWTEPTFPHTTLTQTYQMVAKPGKLAYAVNEPVHLGQEYTVISRGESDFAALTVDAQVYTATSWIPDATIEELQSTGEDYPDEVRERYLQLPEIPSRVRQKAEEVAAEAGALTAYDKARAIESYLRGFGYDLELEPPPLDADVVDYFLFTAERGYCDYSATAMVVMLRALGVPARYASGFAMGRYSHSIGAWQVTQSNGHAWAEVYFPGFGWIEFEPTPAQDPFTRAASRWDASMASGPAPPERQRVPPLWIAAGALALVLLFVVIWPPRWFRRRRLEPRRAVWRVYHRLLRRARWLGLSPYGGQTPREYLRGLAVAVEHRARFASGSGKDIAVIEEVYQRARYGHRPITEAESLRAEGAWRRLRSRLLRLMFVRVQRSNAAR